MKLLIQSVFGKGSSLVTRQGSRFIASASASASSTREYEKRNYASNLSEYNTVIGSLTDQRRPYLLRDAYDDMILDGVQPSRDTFRSLLVGTMKGARLPDAFFFRDQMKVMGLLPDALLYNLLISTCAKCKNSDQAVQILEEMKVNEVKPNGQTYVCLLNACAATGQLDRVYAIVRDMTAAGAGLNKFCYAGLIAAHMNKKPRSDDTAKKIIELVEQSKGWSSVEPSVYDTESIMMGVHEEELYNLPTVDYINRRGGFLSRQLTVYHVAFHACADLKNVEALETLMEMLKKNGRYPDVYITMQTMRCYLHSGYIDNGLRIFEGYMKSDKSLPLEMYTTLVEGAMFGYTPEGMKVAQDTLEKMSERNFFLNSKVGNDLLLVAAGEKSGGYTMANYIWDLMQSRNVVPSFPAVEAYFNGLKEREIPEDDPRLLVVSGIYDKLRNRFRRGPARE